jgi:hypothetical protein
VTGDRDDWVAQLEQAPAKNTGHLTGTDYHDVIIHETGSIIGFDDVILSENMPKSQLL